MYKLFPFSSNLWDYQYPSLVDLSMCPVNAEIFFLASTPDWPSLFLQACHLNSPSSLKLSLWANSLFCLESSFQYPHVSLWSSLWFSSLVDSYSTSFPYSHRHLWHIICLGAFHKLLLSIVLKNKQTLESLQRFLVLIPCLVYSMSIITTEWKEFSERPITTQNSMPPIHSLELRTLERKKYVSHGRVAR